MSDADSSDFKKMDGLEILWSLPIQQLSKEQILQYITCLLIGLFVGTMIVTLFYSFTRAKSQKKEFLTMRLKLKTMRAKYLRADRCLSKLRVLLIIQVITVGIMGIMLYFSSKGMFYSLIVENGVFTTLPFVMIFLFWFFLRGYYMAN